MAHNGSRHWRACRRSSESDSLPEKIVHSGRNVASSHVYIFFFCYFTLLSGEMLDAETLINEVFMKPEIWDKRLKSYSNRAAVDRAWQDIAKEMGVADSVLRRKWKYLRDQFSVEFGKINMSPRSGDPGGTSYVPKWPHYSSLLFLEDVVKPRGFTRNSTTSIKSVQPHEPVDEVIESVDDTVNQSDEGRTDARHVSRGSGEEDSSLQDVTRLKRRRIQKNVSLVAGDRNKSQVLEEDFRMCQAESEDLLFFRSLLPHVSKIPDNRKLRFRSRIQEVVDEFAYSLD